MRAHKTKQCQLITPIDQVNRCDYVRIAGGSKTGISRFLAGGTQPLAEFDKLTAHIWVCPKLDASLLTPYRHFWRLVGQLFGSSFAFLRCSLLSLRPHASNTHDEKLIPGFSPLSRSTLASISSMSSCGNLIPFVVERLFLKPVAMLFPLHWCRNTIQVKKESKSIDVYMHLDIWCLCTLFLNMAQIAKPRSARTLAGPLTTTDRLSIEVAMSDHTTPLTGRNSHTPNKFTWRFLALSRIDRKAKPCRLSVVACTEREARQVLAPYFILSLAARLPVREASYV